MGFEAYLDIETTGLNTLRDEITVVGIFIDKGDNGLVQLVGREISSSRIIDLVKDVDVIYTYNGSRFDLPFIKENLGLNLIDFCYHHDLMYECWKRRLFGGLKGVERTLGIERSLPWVNGMLAVELWYDYITNQNLHALQTLLKYNEEDVVNLRELRYRLEEPWSR